MAALAGSPWWFGGVQAVAQVWLFAGILTALACWAICEWKDRSPKPILPAVVYLMVAAIGLGIVQLAPLPEAAVEILVPGRAAYLQTCSLGPTQADAALEARLGVPASSSPRPLSLYPASTRHDLALLLLALGALALGSGLFRHPGAQVWLCGLAAVNGAALVFFGLTQKLTWNGMLYWTVELAPECGPFGPFVNRNNAGGYLLLCLAGALGLVAWRVGRDRSRGIHPINGTTLTTVSLAAFILAGVFCTLSRGAAVAALGAIVLTVAVLFCTRRRLRWLVPLVLTTAAGLATALGLAMDEPTRSRLATLLDFQTLSQHSLLPHWKDGLRVVPGFWPVGSGLGTYRYVYLPFEHRLVERCFYHAENQYLESLVDGGVVGLGLMLSMIVLVAIAAWRLLRRDPDDRAVAFGIAAVFGLSAQGIAAIFDFGLYIPANMLFFAVICGGVCGRAAQLEGVRRPGRSRVRQAGRLAWPVAATLSLAGVLWGWQEIGRCAVAEAALRSAKLPGIPTPEQLHRGVTSPQELAALYLQAIPSRKQLDRGITALSSALEVRPDDAELHQRRAEFSVGLYWLEAMDEMRSARAPTPDQATLAQRTLPLVLHRRAHLYADIHRPVELEALRSAPAVKKHLFTALRHFVLSRRSCPLLTNVHLTLAQLCVLAADPSEDRIHLERARRLGCSDPNTLFLCGLLELHAGRAEQVWSDWRSSLVLTPRYLNGILAFCGPQLIVPGMVEKLFPDDPLMLVRLAQSRYQGKAGTPVRQLLLNRAEQLLDQVPLSEGEQCYLRGSILATRRDFPKAIHHYTRAVEFCSENIGWRYEFALLLKSQGMLEEAHEQAVWCCFHAPYQPQYRDLLNRIVQARLVRP